MNLQEKIKRYENILAEGSRYVMSSSSERRIPGDWNRHGWGIVAIREDCGRITRGVEPGIVLARRGYQDDAIWVARRVKTGEILSGEGFEDLKEAFGGSIKYAWRAAEQLACCPHDCEVNTTHFTIVEDGREEERLSLIASPNEREKDHKLLSP